jgi:tryptophanyl-tRNA synthetase
MSQQVILSGMQPTGSLHLGNYEGALKNWVSLQDEFEMYCCIVDWHSLTSLYDKTEVLNDQVFQMAVDFIACGLDPEKCAIFVQSQVKEHAELHLLLSMIVPIPWLERVPSYKEKSQKMGLDSYGFLGYPLLQAADILLYRANFVPVGKDQLPHIELTREIARRFNGYYGDVFPEPQDKLTKFAAVPGTDGNRMSKSYGNHISLSDTPEETAAKISKMFTDPEKLRLKDPGHPDICPVYALHKIYTDSGLDKIAEDCRSGDLGCVADKKVLIENLNNKLAPIRDRANELNSTPDTVWDILKDGADKARNKAQETMEMVRKAVRLLP